MSHDEAKSVKETVLEVVDRLPDECDWDEVMYQLSVRRKIEEGLADSAAGRVYSHEEVFREFERNADLPKY